VRRHRDALRGLVTVLLAAGAVSAASGDRPEILYVAVSGHPVAGRAAEARLTYHARQANVVAVVLVVEDLDGPRRVTSQREIGVIAAAFGREEGHLVIPLGFGTPGRKRVVFTLLTDEREESDSASVELVVAP
jgi:hypothetical protein